MAGCSSACWETNRGRESSSQEVLRVYDAIWRLRACSVQRTSGEAGELFKFRDHQVEDRDPIFSTILASRFDWLGSHDMQSDLVDAFTRSG